MHQPVGLLQFHCCWRVYFILITAICKHFIHVKAVGLRWCAGFIVATPMMHKWFPLLRAQSSGSTPSIAWVYSLVLLSLGSYSSCKIASATVLWIPFISLSGRRFVNFWSIVSQKWPLSPKYIHNSSALEYVCSLYHKELQYIAKLRRIMIDLYTSRLVTIETPRNHTSS